MSKHIQKAERKKPLRDFSALLGAFTSGADSISHIEYDILEGLPTLKSV